MLVAGALALAPSPVLVAPAPARQPDLPALLAEAASNHDIYEPRVASIVAREDYELSMLSGLIDTRDTGFRDGASDGLAQTAIRPHAPQPWDGRVGSIPGRL